MSTPPLKTSGRRFRGMPLTGIALLAALTLAGCGDGDQGEAAGNDDDAAQVDSDTEDGGAAGDGSDTDGSDTEDDGTAEDDEQGAQAGPSSSENPFATAELTDMASNGIGTVSFTELEDGVLIEAEVHDLDAGFRGITIHERGVCEPQSSSDSGVFGDFESSGGHLVGTTEEDMGIVEGEEPPQEEPAETNLDDLSEAVPPTEPEAVDHPDHAGDLPNLMVNQDRTGWLSLVTDRLVPDDLISGEGSSVIVHAQADNHGNVPERYFGPDAETLTNGDSGSRVACGVVEEQ